MGKDWSRRTFLKQSLLAAAALAAGPAAVRATPQGPAKRVQTRTRFWEPQGLSGVVLTERPWSVFARTPDPATRRGILESYSAGTAARRIAKSGESPLLQAFRDTAAVFPELADQFEGGAAKLWDEDEWARGAYPGWMQGALASGVRAAREILGP